MQEAHKSQRIEIGTSRREWGCWLVVNHGSPKAEPGVRFPPSLPKKSMKKFLLYFLLILFIVGLAMLAYGFWNAKNIRLWASEIGEIKTRHDFAANENNIATGLNSLSGKKAEEFKSELDKFNQRLKSVSDNLILAKQEIEKTNPPGAAKSVRPEIIEYYRQGSQNVSDLANVIEFTNQVFVVTIIFDRITANTTLEDIRKMIGEAKTKSEGINPEMLPAEIKSSGTGLKSAVNSYLEALDQFASGKAENHDELNASYENFSQKQNNFWEARKNLPIYANSQKLKLLGDKIDSELMVLSRVRFSVK